MKFLAKLFGKAKSAEGKPVTPYAPIPRNLEFFYPEIWDKVKMLPAGSAMSGVYPAEYEMFRSRAVWEFGDYIEKHRIEPKDPDA